MSKVKQNEKADYCLEYEDKPSCHYSYATEDEQFYKYKGITKSSLTKESLKDKDVTLNKMPLVTQFLDKENGCCILQKKVPFEFASYGHQEETTVFLSKNGKHIQILHSYDCGHPMATYHYTKLSVSDFKKINKALNKNLKIKKEKKNN